MRAHKLVAAALSAAFIAGPAAAAEVNAALAFARKHKDIYASELKDADVLSRPIVTQISIRADEITTEYDDLNGNVMLRRRGHFDSRVYRSCAHLGRAAGVTAMGVRGSYDRYACEEVNVSESIPYLQGKIIDHWSWVRIAATPAQYRRIQKEGLLARYWIEPTKSGRIATFARRHDGATLSDRTEILTNEYMIYGRVVRAEYFLPGSSAPAYTATIDQPLPEHMRPAPRYTPAPAPAEKAAE